MRPRRQDDERVTGDLTTGDLALDDPATIRAAYAGKLWPDDVVHAFANAHRMFPTRRITRGDGCRKLSRGANPLGEFQFESAGESYDLYDYASRNRVAGLLLLKDGEILLERYQLGATAETRWLSMSMAKSVSSTLVGAAVRDGHIRDLDDPLGAYAPALREGAFAEVTVRQLLQMVSGVKWNESHTDPASERRQVLELQLDQRAHAIRDFMSALPRVDEPGARWNYSTGETHMVGVLLHAATGRWLADYLSEKIWQPAGMEDDATWWLESPDGLEVAGSGISARLRDYGRFGLFVLDEGVAAGETTLPPGWLAESTRPQNVAGETVGYGFSWWCVPEPDGSYAGAFSARGIFGQRIYLDPRKRLVIVVLSARSKPMYSEAIDDNHFFNAVAQAL